MKNVLNTESAGRIVSAAVIIAGVAGGASVAAAQTAFAVTSNQSLISFDVSTPSIIDTGVAISGLASNERVHGIDFRPANGQLYALGSQSNLYTINTSTGAASLVGSFGNLLNGSSFGFDFNPVIDRIRVVSEADQNLVLNPNDGTSTMVTSLFYGAGDMNEGVNPNVVGSAYSNSVAGATSTQLYGVDTNLDVLVFQANSAGTLSTIGSLGVDVNDTLTFDIDGASGVAFMTIQNVLQTRSTFWTVDLSSGMATSLGEIGGGALITSMAVIPAPGAIGLILTGSVLAGRRRR